MPTFLAHIEVALIFGVVFAIGSVIWDFDHLSRCSPKNLASAILTNNQDPVYQAENLSKGGCRSFAHSLWFAAAFTALYLAFVIHMLMDAKGGVGI